MRADTRAALRDRAFTVWLDVGIDESWRRVRRSDRPLAQDEARFRELYARGRRPTPRRRTSVTAGVDGVLLAAGGILVERGAVARLGELVPGEGPCALVGDERVLGLHPAGLGDRLVSTHSVPSGREREVARRLRAALGRAQRRPIGYRRRARRRHDHRRRRLRRRDVSARRALGTRAVDARRPGRRGDRREDGDRPARRGRTSSGRSIRRPGSSSTLTLLDTLPPAQRAEGMAEIVKTGLLAGREIWRLDEVGMVRACAAFKASVVLADPSERGRRAILNLGHTFAHGIEAAGGLRRADPRPTRSRSDCVLPCASRFAISVSTRPFSRRSSTAARRAGPVDPRRGLAGDGLRQEGASAAASGSCCSRRPGGPSSRSSFRTKRCEPSSAGAPAQPGE